MTEPSTTEHKSAGAAGRPLVRHGLAIALILVLAISRLALARAALSHPEAGLLTDSRGYLELAESLRQLGRFQASPHEESLRTPVYPVFLAAVQLVFGRDVGMVLVVQLCVSLGTAWLVWRTGRELAGPAAGVAAAWFYALNPNALFWAATVMSETLFAFWLALTAFLLASALRRASWVWWAASGAALGLAVLTRPIGVYLVPVWALGALLSLRRAGGGRAVVHRWAVFLLAALVPIAAWQTRNAVVHGRFFLSNVGSATFSNYIVGYILEDALGVPREEAVGLLAGAPSPLAYSLEVIREYPASFVRVTVRGVVRTLLGTEVGVWLPVGFGLTYQGSGLLGSIFSGDWAAAGQALGLRAQGDLLSTALLAWGIGYSLFLYLAVIRGLAAGRGRWRSGRGWVVAVLAVSAAYLLLVPLSNGDARFRLPAEPWLACLAGPGCARPTAATAAGGHQEP